ncbi:MAG: ABC transporter permease [Thermoanaerobaculia bacterium]|nr:ABC transporter permease [Thermoanaerobaculia bacterium]
MSDIPSPEAIGRHRERARPVLACFVVVLSVVLVVVALIALLRTVELGELGWNWDPPAVPEPDRFVRIELSGVDSVSSVHDLPRRLEGQRALAYMALWQSGHATFRMDGVADGVFRGAAVTEQFFDAVGVAPLLGRVVALGDVAVVVLGHSVWNDWLGADPAVIGRTIKVGGQELTVVGVMPDSFSFPDGNQFWLPLTTDGSEIAEFQGTDARVQVFGKLLEGITSEQAEAELNEIIARDPGQAGLGEGPTVEIVPFFSD